MKVVRFSALRTGHLYPPGNIPGTHFCQRLSRPQGHSAAGRIMSMKNSSETIGNRTRDLSTYSAVPQPTAPPRAPTNTGTVKYMSTCVVQSGTRSSTYKSASIIAKPHSDIPECTIHLHINYTVPVLVTAVFLKTNIRVQNTVM